MHIFRKIKYGLKNLIIWFPIIWKDRNWDYFYMFVIMHKKLILMEKYIRNYGISVNAKKDADRIKICHLILKRIIDDNYSEMALKPYNELYDFDLNRKMDDKELKLFKKCMKRGNLLRLQDINYLFDYMKKYIFMWWD